MSVIKASIVGLLKEREDRLMQSLSERPELRTLIGETLRPALGERLGTTEIDVDEIEKVANFTPFSVENVLVEGFAILERCIELRALDDDLRVKDFEVQLQLKELETLNLIVEKEETDLYPKRILLEGVFKEAAKVTTEELDKLSGFLIGERKNWTDLEGSVRGEAGIKGDNGVVSGSHYRAMRDMNAYSTQLHMQQGAHDSAIRRSKAEQAYQELAEYIARMTSEYQIKRNQVARISANMRGLATTQADAPLNYLGLRESLRKQFESCLEAAAPRLCAASDGLAVLFGYKFEVPFPKRKGHYDLDDVYVWCQSAAAWLANCLNRQEVVACSLSIRALVGEKLFESMAEKGLFTFTLAQDAFHLEDNHKDRNLGMKTIGIEAVCNDATAVWNAQVNFPVSKFFANKEGGFARVAHLGNVRCLQFSVLERVAPSQIQNVPPFGEWTIRLTPVHGKTVATDFYIHLNCSTLGV
jgi:hypothetical protein